MLKFIEPNWPAPSNVKAFSTTRLGGVSVGPFSGLNLGSHVSDELDAVLKNRQRLTDFSALPRSPFWLNQTHSTRVVSLPYLHKDSIPDADASITSTSKEVCCVMTADCLPVLICDKSGTQVAAIHAGWRGLLDGIIENTLSLFNAPANELLIWLGPAISQAAFQVGGDVRDQFIQHDSEAHLAFIADKMPNKWRADIYTLAKQRLITKGILSNDIFGGEYCTYEDPSLFYSYRRNGKTGRQAALIYLES